MHNLVIYLVTAVFLLTAQSGFAQTTKLKSLSEPSHDKVKNAIKNLESSLKVSTSSADYSELLKQSRNLLKYEEKNITYKAQIICENKDYIKETVEDEGYSLFCFDYSEICFNGDVKEALRLINAAFNHHVYEFFKWETYALKNAEVNGDHILATWYDEEYENLDETVIKSCKK